MKWLTYLLYIAIWDGGIIAGCTYLVFWMNQSGWWYALAIIICGSAYPPERWGKLMDGK